MRPVSIAILGLAAIVLLRGPGSTASAQKIDQFPTKQLRTTYRISGASFLKSFREVVDDARTWTVRVERKHPKTERWVGAAHGVVVREDGLILTKASEAEGEIRVRLPDRSGDYPAAKVVALDDANDLALLRIDMDGISSLPVVSWSLQTPEVGRWLATPTIYRSPAAVGIVSVPARRIPRTELPGMLGVEFKRVDGLGDAAVVGRLTSNAPADRAGINVDDIIHSVDGRRTSTIRQVIQAISRRHPGDRVTLGLYRDGDPDAAEELNVRLAQPNTELLQSRRMRFDMMNSLGGDLSERRSNFPLAVQHDSVLEPEDCGGAVVNLDGEAVGINIARAGRTESLMIPASHVRPILDRMLREADRG